MKFLACEHGRHGACSTVEALPQLDENAEVIALYDVACECWCHVAPIPEPPKGETLFNGGWPLGCNTGSED